MTSEFYKRNVSEEQRKARSEMAKRMHDEVVIDPLTGEERRKFGGRQPRSGRPRKPRMTEVMAELALREGEAYFHRLDDIAKNHPSANAAIAAIREIIEVTEKERKIEQEEQLRLERLQRDDLIYLALDLLEKTGLIGDADIVDGEIEGEEYRGYPELGEGTSGASEA